MAKYTHNTSRIQFKYVTYGLQLLLLAAAYYYSARLGLKLATVSNNVTLVWPPSGIALAALLIFGNRLWPGVVVGATLTAQATGGPPGYVAGVAVGNTLAALAGAAMVRHVLGSSLSIEQVKNVLGLLFFGGLASTLIAAVIGTANMRLSGLAAGVSLTTIWSTWWFGDAMGVMVLTPALLAWAEPPRKISSLRQILEAAILLVAVVIFSQMVFGDWLGDRSAPYPLAYLAFPLLIWAAFRFGQRGATSVSLVIICMALWGTLQGYGPFASPSSRESVVLIWIFMGIVAISATIMAAVIAERRQVEKDLVKQRDFAMTVTNALGQGVVVTSAAGKFEFANPAIARITGYAVDELIGKSPEDLTLPEDYPVLNQALKDRRMLKTSNYELRLRHKSGRIIYVLATGTPRVEAGQFTGSIIVITDLTERKYAEQALQNSEARNRALLNAIPDLMLLQDRAGIFLDFHVADDSILLMPPESFLGKNMRDVLPLNILAPSLKYFEMVVQTGQPQVFEYPAQIGQELHYFESRMVLCGDTQILSIIRDVTARRQTEAQLNQLQERFSKAFHANPSAISIATFVEGLFVDVNPRFLEIFGFDREEVIGHSLLDLNMLPDQNTRRMVTNTLRTKGHFYNVEMQLRTKTNQIRYTLASMELIELNNQKHILAMFYDITERVAAETALRRSEELYRLIFQSSPVGIFHFDQNLIITRFNDRFASILGTAPEQLMGLNMLNLKDQSVLPALRTAVAGREGYYEGEYTTTTSGVQIYIAMWTAPVFDETRQVRGGIGIVQDMTERVQTEFALRESEERFRQVIASISDYIYVAYISPDGSHKNTYLSPTYYELTGYRRRKFFEDNDFWPSLIHPDDQPFATKQATRLAQGLNSETEYRILRADGRLIWVRDSARVESHPDGSKIVYGVLTNITERKRLEEQLYQAHKLEAIGRLAGGIAHDFNNILTVIIGNTELLLDTLSEDSPARKDVEQINKVGNRAAALTGQLLAFSRQQILTPKIINLNTVVADMDKMLRRLIGEHIDLVTIFEPELGPIKADSGQIEQVILNLAVNARDAMPDGGKLTIETANIFVKNLDRPEFAGLASGSHVILTVSDTGIGMDEDTRVHIFEPFFTTKEQGKGTGLGLATIHGIVTQSGGQIWVESQAQNGTIFKVYFPQADKSVDSEPAPPALSRRSPEKATILLVEDEEMVRSITRRALVKEGFTVLEASRSAEALELAGNYAQPIHLLLTDMVMPGGMNGHELAKILVEQRPTLKIMYMSGYADLGVTEIDAPLLQKPFTTQTLVERVRQMLQVTPHR
ncbi:MAG: Sensor histidine kinase RcsC [Anaerolineae bacterium]|nr:Sensor histidine kinase RcsC [Anaerolineae bacterium]